MGGDQFDNVAYDADRRSSRESPAWTKREKDYGEDAPTDAELADD